MLMLIHPVTADVAVIRRTDQNKRALFMGLLECGYVPVGPNARAAAARLTALTKGG